ncbi:AraC family transcriptional regulator [Paenibacillus mesophilus]|uniref:AraC family transcriptional regulator n=1 Tax=Paenibacillus mesophilus TaxID=2582849 RepID=UPI00110D6E96|nr:AraC family transcriptional regulator [Paenibacillus mesophilus]TMV48023.1 AraC family transcriptional regulator [Paenibacillus mesophilus]
MKIDNIAFQQAVNGNWRVPRKTVKHDILILVIRGAAAYRIGEEAVVVRKGEGLFFPEGTLRSAEADKSEPLQLYSAHFRDLSIEGHPLRGEPYVHIRPLGCDYLKQRFSMLYEHWIGKMPGYEFIACGILMEILGLVHRERFGDSHSSSRRNLALRVQQYIVQHYREPLRLSDMAQVVNRSPTYVSSVFKEVTGRPPIEYMHEVRIAAARELLLTDTMTIGEIAESLGYCDQTYFNYMYKKIVGHPPSHTLKM